MPTQNYSSPLLEMETEIDFLQSWSFVSFNRSIITPYFQNVFTFHTAAMKEGIKTSWSAPQVTKTSKRSLWIGLRSFPSHHHNDIAVTKIVFLLLLIVVLRNSNSNSNNIILVEHDIMNMNSSSKQRLDIVYIYIYIYISCDVKREIKHFIDFIKKDFTANYVFIC